MERCGATTRSGEPCKAWPVHGMARCRMHGGASTGAPEQNTNAVTHGAYADIVADQIQDSVFQAIPSDPTLDTEMRILRYKLYRLLDSSVIQNIVAGYNIEQMEADELAKITGITALASEIRKLSKEMQQTGQDDPLAKLVSDWEKGMRSEGKLGDEATPEHTP